MTEKQPPKFSKPAIVTACLSFAFLTFCLIFANPLMPTYAFTEAFWVANPPTQENYDPTLTLSRTGQETWTINQQTIMNEQMAAETSLAAMYLEPKPVSSAAAVVTAAATSSRPKTTVISKSSQLTKDQLLALSVPQLAKINKDFVGILFVEGSSITELVVAGATNETYLRSDFYGNYAYYGTIFGDSRTSKTKLDRNTILMGHNTGKSKPNDHAFGKLRYFRTAGYAKSHPYITFRTVHGDYKFQIFSAFVTSGPVTTKNYPTHFMRMEFKDDAEFESYLKLMKSQSLYDTGVSISGSDKIITLVCCVYDFEDARLVLQAKLVS